MSRKRAAPYGSTSGNGQGSHPADDCTLPSPLEEARDATLTEHAEDGTKELDILLPKHVCAFRAAACVNQTGVSAHHLKELAMKGALGDIGRQYSQLGEASDSGESCTNERLYDHPDSMDHFEQSIDNQSESDLPVSQIAATVEQLDNGADE